MQYNFYTVPLLMLIPPMLWVIRTAWQRRTNFTTRMFLFFALLAMGLVITYILELVQTTLDTILFWAMIEYFFHWSLVFWLLFTLSYAGYGKLINRWSVAALLVFPLIIVGLVVTNDQHHLIWATVGMTRVNGFVFFDRTYGVFFWLWNIYLYGLAILGGVLLIWRIAQSDNVYRGQVIWLSVGLAIPLIANLLSIFELAPIKELDLTPYAIGIATIPVAISLFRYRLFDLMPVVFSTVVQNMQDGVVLCDYQNRVIDINPAGRKILEFVPAEIVGLPLGQVLPALATSKNEEEITLNNRTYNVRVTWLDDPPTPQSNYILVMRDITSQKQSDQQVLQLGITREKVHLLETLIADVSHDLRTPITVMMTTTDLLLAQLNRWQQSQTALPVSEVTESLEKRVNTLIHYSRVLQQIIEQFEELLNIEKQVRFISPNGNLNTVAQQVVNTYQGQIVAKNLHLTVELVPDIPLIPMMEMYIHNALSKILENAVTYTDPGGTITLRTYSSQDEVVCEIRDTGSVSLRLTSRIFLSIFTGNTARPVTGGTGLGLPIALRIAEGHAGRITVESTLGEGSVFRFYLPLRPNEKLVMRPV